MTMNLGRTAAVVRKEIRDYRRSRSILATMLVLPVIFLVQPMLSIIRLSSSVPATTVDRTVSATFLVLLVAPALIPAVLAASSVVGEREQGTLEPLLITPVRREELLLGKAVATIVPAVVIAYVLFAVIEVSARLVASNASVSPGLSSAPHVVAEVLFAPLLAAWSTWVGIGISVRATDVRVAQQLGSLASLPPLAVVALVSFNVFTPSVGLAVAFALALLAGDVILWRIVSAMFDRERLITGSSARQASRSSGST